MDNKIHQSNTKIKYTLPQKNVPRVVSYNFVKSSPIFKTNVKKLPFYYAHGPWGDEINCWDTTTSGFWKQRGSQNLKVSHVTPPYTVTPVAHVSIICPYTSSKMVSPLVNCIVSNAVVNATLSIQEVLLLSVNVKWQTHRWITLHILQ